MMENRNNRKRVDQMTENKDEFDKKDDELNKWDYILANTFVIVLAIGLLVAGIVIMKMAY